VNGDAGGYVANPRAMYEVARKLPLEQRWLLFELAHDARWEAGIVTVRGVEIALDVGELLISLDGLAEKHGMSVDQVRRALKTFERLGIISRRQAATLPATSPATGAATLPATQTATPPTVVRFQKWRTILWPRGEAATSPATNSATGTATPAATGAATILPAVPDLPLEQGEPVGGERASARKSFAPPPASPPAFQTGGGKNGKGKNGRATDPRFMPIKQRLKEIHAEICDGSIYDFNGADGKALREFLERHPEVTEQDVRLRWALALHHRNEFPRVKTPRMLFHHWNHFADEARQFKARVAHGEAVNAELTEEEELEHLSSVAAEGDGLQRVQLEREALLDVEARKSLRRSFPGEYPALDDPGWKKGIHIAARES